MTNPLQLASIPQVTIDAGVTVTFEALSPTTGATITGVIVSNGALYGINAVDSDASDLPELGPTMFTVEQLEGEVSGA